MIITASNKDNAILSDIIGVLSTIKDGAKANKGLVCDDHWVNCTEDFFDLDDTQFESMSIADFIALATDCGEFSKVTVQFFTDPARTIQLFSLNTQDDPEFFTVQPGIRLVFTPTDAILNDEYVDMALPIYYVTITKTGTPDIVKQTTYKNADNLLFNAVVVSTSKKSQLTLNGNICVVVPGDEKQENQKISDQLGYVTYSFDLMIQLVVFNWKDLSELERVKVANNVNNLIRLALYTDRYRQGHCTLKDKDIDGTNVGQIALQPSVDVMKANLNIKCVSYASNSSY